MNHISLFLICILAIEVIQRLRFSFFLKSIIVDIEKTLKIASNSNISDHWKEKFIPAYSIKIIKSSLRIILILLLIFLMLVITEIFLDNFIDFLISYLGLVESILFVFGYFYFKKIVVR